jgi:hypothetical protein
MKMPEFVKRILVAAGTASLPLVATLLQLLATELIALASKKDNPPSK